jgi:hypothetical protein
MIFQLPGSGCAMGAQGQVPPPGPWSNLILPHLPPEPIEISVETAT